MFSLPAALRIARGLAVAVAEVIIAIHLGLAGHRAAIPGIERALHCEGAFLARAERRTITCVAVAAIVPAAPVIAIANRGADIAALETNVASVNHGAGVGIGLAAFDVARAAAGDRHARLGAGVGEVDIRLAGAIGERDRDAVVVGLSVAALVAQRLATNHAPVIFPAIAIIAVLPVAGVVLVPPTFGATADAMNVTVVFLPAGAAVAVSPVVAGGSRGLAISGRRSDRNDIAAAREIGEAITAVFVGSGLTEKVVRRVQQGNNHVRNPDVA